MKWFLPLASLFAMTTVCSAEDTVDVPLPIPRPTTHAQSPPTPPQRPLPTAIVMSLEDAVFLGLRSNRTIQSSYINRAVEKFDLRIAENQFTPQFALAGNAAIDQVGPGASTRVEVSPTITMDLPTGTTFSFSWANVASYGQGGDSFSSVGEISIEQPLFRGAGTAVNMAPLQSARIGEQANMLRLEATVAETIASIIYAHRDLQIAQEELRLAQAARTRAQELISNNRALIDAGRLAEVEMVQTEADLESQNLRVLSAIQQLEMSRLRLLDVLALDLTTQIVAVENANPQEVTLNANQLIATAMSRRPDYIGQLYAIEQNRLGMVVAENEQLWDVSLFARGRFGWEYASGFGGGNNVHELSVGVRFSVPIDDLPRQRQVVSADANLLSAELQLSEIQSGLEMQIRITATEIELLWRQIAIAERAVELARQAVEIEITKLNAGRSTTFQVRVMEAELRSAEIQLSSARIGYLNALTRLDLQLGITLDTWNIGLLE